MHWRVHSHSELASVFRRVNNVFGRRVAQKILFALLNRKVHWRVHINYEFDLGFSSSGRRLRLLRRRGILFALLNRNAWVLCERFGLQVSGVLASSPTWTCNLRVSRACRGGSN